MIDSDLRGFLLGYFDLGASTAENDPLLESAKIETQEWNDLYFHDRIDLIRGIKGSGKTALYRLFSLLQKHMIVGGLINAPQMVVPNLAQAAPIMDRAVPG
ncbi:MAG: hypothetical protein ABSB95_04915 [Dissulfurispiraceae bacterium]|jgi:hypothetical protein